MLHGIQPKSVNAGLSQIPPQPLLGLLHDDGVVHIHVHAHQVVKVALFRVGLLGPLLSGEAEDPVQIILRALGPVRPREAGVVPDETAVSAFPAGEGEFRPHPYLFLTADLLVAVILRVGNCCHFLNLVTTHPVVEHNVGKHLDAGIVEGPDRLQIFFFRAVFGPYRSFLVELAQIVHIINTVAHVFLRGALVSRRQPYFADPQRCEILGLSGTALPPESVIRQVPLKILHHGLVVCFLYHNSSVLSNQGGLY